MIDLLRIKSIFKKRKGKGNLCVSYRHNRIAFPFQQAREIINRNSSY